MFLSTEAASENHHDRDGHFYVINTQGGTQSLHARPGPGWPPSPWAADNHWHHQTQMIIMLMSSTAARPVTAGAQHWQRQLELEAA